MGFAVSVPWLWGVAVGGRLPKCYRRAFPSPEIGTRRILLNWYVVLYEPTTRAFGLGVAQKLSREARR